MKMSSCPQFSLLIGSFFQYKNKLTAIKRMGEKLYFQNKLELAKNNIKETWKIIKEAINKNRPISSCPEKFKSGSRDIDNPREISSKFNDFFVTIGPNLDKKIEAPTIDYKTFLGISPPNSFFFAPVTDNEIASIVNLCKNKSSSGHDEIPMTIIKRTINQILAPLTHICNLSLANGLVPSKMKIASVTPIYKADAADEFSNYRPISLLPNFSKILEKVVFNRLTNFLSKNDILYEQQYGFRENYSTELALVDLTDRIAQAMDNKKSDSGCFY